MKINYFGNDNFINQIKIKLKNKQVQHNIVISFHKRLGELDKWLNTEFKDQEVDIIVFSTILINDYRVISQKKYNILSVQLFDNKLNDKNKLFCFGSRDCFNDNKDLLSELGNPEFMSNQIILGSILNHSINGIHYASILALLDGMALCKKYNFSVQEFIKQTQISMPLLSQAAYRNIMQGLLSEDSYETVNDDIHAMEMLVCKIKKNGAVEEIVARKDRQVELNRMLLNYWNELAINFLKESKDV